jgi:hypothetical protein
MGHIQLVLNANGTSNNYVLSPSTCVLMEWDVSEELKIHY